MAIPRQPAVWGERRNTPAVRRPAPTSLADALRSCREFRKARPEHARWIEEGHPTLTKAEHEARFGEPYTARRGRK